MERETSKLQSSTMQQSENLDDSSWYKEARISASAGHVEVRAVGGEEVEYLVS